MESTKGDPLIYLQGLPNLAHLELLQVYDGNDAFARNANHPTL